MTTPNYFEEIKKWKLESNEEDSSRYFYEIPGVSDLQDGSACFVVGRKGSGKTAIAEHIRSTVGPTVFSRSLSFKSFPINELYKLSDNGFSTSSQYITLWKMVIYTAICDMMADNHAIDPDVTSDLRKYFDVNLEKALSSSIARVSEKFVGLSLKDIGANGSIKKEFISNGTAWNKRVEILERVIETYIDDSEYYILFDELDDEYEDILNTDKRKQYFNLLKGLFKAVQDIRKTIGKGAKTKPIVFIRDDIYDVMTNSDRNKWDDLCLKLDWSEGMLQKLLAFRISRAIDPTAPILGFMDAYKKVFLRDTVRINSRRSERRSAFRYILSRTLMRPRDVVSYIRECARTVVEWDAATVTPEAMRQSEKRYSQRFRQEFIDEIQSVLPNVSDIFDIISNIRKQVFGKVEFAESYASYSTDNNDTADFLTVIKILYHFSVIGNQPSQETARIFKYENPSTKLNTGEKFCVHRGLYKSLEIT